ncbi:MAG: hypothetical protein M1817_003990 [Caeruleum heppii]|nr:MAG: hypothetical protein M1817_003990 [Caeruleum heppii]
MPLRNVRADAALADDEVEITSLLSSPSSSVNDLVVHSAPDKEPQGDGHGSPHTPHRVRFQLDETPNAAPNGHARASDAAWADEEDYLAYHAPSRQRDNVAHRAPLLTDIEAPSLAKASTLALISMVIILITVLTQGLRVPDDLRGSFGTRLLTVNYGVFQAIGVISFAFVCHHNSLLIYGSLKKPTLDRFARVTHFSTSISMAACMIMAVAGFLIFGDKTQGNVLNNFPTDNIMVNIARFCFGLNMLTTLPLEAFVCREVMTNYYFPDEPWNANLHLILSSSLVVSAMTLSLFTCDLGAVFELIGATSACALAYILPPLCYIKLSSRSWKTVPAMVCVGFGCCVVIISLTQAVVKIIKNEGGTHTCS